jgi:hypothetical protein
VCVCVCVCERERENVGGGIEKDLAVLKFPRQCPLVLVLEVRLACGIRSILIFKEVGAAPMGRNVG